MSSLFHHFPMPPVIKEGSGGDEREEGERCRRGREVEEREEVCAAIQPCIYTVQRKERSQKTYR